MNYSKRLIISFSFLFLSKIKNEYLCIVRDKKKKKEKLILILNSNPNLNPNMFFMCCFSKSVHMPSVEEKEETSSKPSHLKSFMNMAMNSFRGSKSNIQTLPIQCKVCNRELKSGEICHCLQMNTHPNNKETNEKIKEQYIQKSEIVKQIAHIDKNPDQLIHLVNDIYEIVERSSLHEDLTPKSMERVKENLVNEICVHLEDYVI